MMGGWNIECNILLEMGFDHWTICLEIDITSSPRTKPFRFKLFWFNHPYFQENFKTWWHDSSTNGGNLMYRFQQKFKCLKGNIKHWNKTTFGNIFEAKRSLEERMSTI
jgi:hypothetical protein